MKRIARQSHYNHVCQSLNFFVTVPGFCATESNISNVRIILHFSQLPEDVTEGKIRCLDRYSQPCTPSLHLTTPTFQVALQHHHRPVPCLPPTLASPNEAHTQHAHQRLSRLTRGNGRRPPLLLCMGHSREADEGGTTSQRDARLSLPAVIGYLLWRHHGDLSCCCM